MKMKYAFMTLIMPATILASWGGAIEGSGNLIKDERTLSNFKNVQVEGACNLVITQDDQQKVVVKTDDNIMPYVETEVSNGKLIISWSDRYNNYDPTFLTVYISSSLLEDVDLLGSGKVSTTNQLKSKTPHYMIKGSGSMNISVAAEAVKASVTGSGSITLEGSAPSAEHSISGSGNIHALSFASNAVKVKTRGSGDCFVNTKTSLDVDITGSGSVHYKGTPEVTRHITGSGKVKPN